MSLPDDTPLIRVEVTDASEWHCFRLVLSPTNGEPIEIMFHARALVELIYKCSLAYAQWMTQAVGNIMPHLIRSLSPEERAAVIAQLPPQARENLILGLLGL
jgi:hypothetical protein